MLFVNKFIDERMKDVNFKLCVSNVKMKWSAYHEPGTAKKKSESLIGVKPITSKLLGGRSIDLSYGELMESEAKY